MSRQQEACKGWGSAEICKADDGVHGVWLGISPPPLALPCDSHPMLHEDGCSFHIALGEGTGNAE